MKNLSIYVFLALFLFISEVNAADENEHILKTLSAIKEQDILTKIRKTKIDSSGWSRACQKTYIKMLDHIDNRSRIKTNQSLIKRLTNKIEIAKTKLESPECQVNSTLASYTSDVAAVILKAFINEKPPKDFIGYQRSAQDIVKFPKEYMIKIYGNVFPLE